MSRLNGNSAQSLLNAAYSHLQFDQGDLLPAEDRPHRFSTEDWIAKGDWLTLAKQVGAEKVFFVNNNPLVVFARSNGSDLATLRMFNRIWCMSRPMFVFIARDGELSVHKLARPPIRTLKDWQETTALDVVTETRLVASRLNTYRREQLESGRLFEDSRFGTFDERADRLLINDLKTVRRELQEAGLDKEHLKYAHSLIGRSIFIRYLEDREILERSYFDEVAKNNPEWQALLDVPLHKPDVNPEMQDKLYPRVLSNHQFTYALFDKLSKDFNGDMFPSDPYEREIVDQQHLSLLQSFLRGDVQVQQKLFFWAYQFDIIPVDLISNIYEEFYHKEKGRSDQKGTHYTPGTLVDFLVSQVLTQELLPSRPRIMDIACGSGIFLVEAFRRLVRFHTHQQNGTRLTAEELRDILRYQIAGIEIEEEAIRVAAFSLYLALLHYQEPKGILEQIESSMRLPNLLFSDSHKTDDFHFNNLLCVNAFKAAPSTIDKITPPDETRFGSFLDQRPHVIVGNPPWGDIDKQEKSFVKRWCRARKYSVGDDEYSQAFIWKTLDLLEEGGVAALLLSSGVLFKHHKNSQKFRREWLSNCKLLEVINFAHVRDVFFRRGTAPFISAVFRKAKPQINQRHVVRYWSAKKLAHADRWQAVVLNRSDLKLIPQYDLLMQERLWKVYWWGNDHDRALIEWMEQAQPLGALRDDEGKRVSPDLSGRGFQENQNPKRKPPTPAWFKKFRELPTKKFQRYGPISASDLVCPPESVEHAGKEELYTGERLLIKRGISQREEPKGVIVARVESIPFSFRNSIHCLKLRNGESWEYKVLLGIFWSSLARYYYFLTSSTWGLWHFELHSSEIARMPMRIPQESGLRERIVAAVTELQSWRSLETLHGMPSVRVSSSDPALRRLEAQLDEAVFDLYELSQLERELIQDLCATGLDFLYNDYNSRAATPVTNVETVQGSYQSIVRKRSQGVLDNYLKVFVQRWAHEADVKLNWCVVQPSGNWPMTAIIFSSHHGAPDNTNLLAEDSWASALRGLSKDLLVPYHSNALYIDGIVRAVTESQIIIVKRSERRLWTGSMAREDAEATLVRLMAAQTEENHIDTPAKPHRRQPLA